MDSVISRDGTRIAYEIIGQGPTLIYITGAVCHRHFQPVLDDARAFGKHFSVYHYDRRGRGDSTDTPPYATLKEVDDLEALIEAAGHEVILYGHSSGAVLALEAALRMPEKIHKALIYAAPYVASAADQNEFQNIREAIRRLLQQDKKREAVTTFLRAIGTPWIFTMLMRLIPGWSRTVELAPTLLYDIALTETTPPLDRLKQIRVPLRIACGGRSTAGIQDVARRLHEAIPDSELNIVPRADHMIGARQILELL